MALATLREAGQRLHRRLSEPLQFSVERGSSQQAKLPEASVQVSAHPAGIRKLNKLVTSQTITAEPTRLPPIAPTSRQERSQPSSSTAESPQKLSGTKPRGLRVRRTQSASEPDTPIQPLHAPSNPQRSSWANWRGRLSSCSTNGITKIREKYRLGRVIGNGAFSCVRLATDRDTGVEWACKVLRLPRSGEDPGEGESTMEEIINEVQVLQTLGRHRSLTSMR
eukprot:scaffold242578_cov45-Prasinocladus_malaysianus.AAC.1